MRGDANGQLQHAEGPVSTAVFRTEGITCAGCAADIETVMRSRDGVISATVDYASGRVSIEYDQNEIDRDQIAGALQGLGLKVSVVA